MSHPVRTVGDVLRVTVELLSGPFSDDGVVLGRADVWNVTAGLEDDGVADYEWAAYQGGQTQTGTPIAHGAVAGHSRADGWARLVSRVLEDVAIELQENQRRRSRPTKPEAAASDPPAPRRRRRRTLSGVNRSYDDLLADADELEHEAALLEAGDSEEQLRFDGAMTRLRAIVERSAQHRQR